YSTIALVAFGLVVFSGIVNAALRVHDLDDLMTAYGEVIVAKAVATVLLGLIGFWHRRFVIARLGTAASATVEFWRLFLFEYIDFAVVLCLAMVLARAQQQVTPVPVGTTSPDEILTCDTIPLKTVLGRYFTE